MVTVALSPKFQVVIPKDIRSALNLVAGQRMEVQLNGGKVELIPDQTRIQPAWALAGRGYACCAWR